MPKPLSPPDLTEMGALTFPRELQRWLDVNPVTKLTRVAGYITLPVFNVNVSWLGYSDIVAAFNYEGPNWFSLKEFSTVVPLNPNYMLCIAYVKNGITYRYSLWRGVGEVIYFDIPLYTGQKIGKNFRFEVWSTNNTPLIQATSLTFYTSVLGSIDYRYGSDFTLVNSDAICTNFQSNFNMPYKWPAGAYPQSN